ncbi:putative AdoMet-dependent methyltransferase [Rossellomorea marisflavi]
MLNSTGFDLWAGRYDETVKESEESNQYPFAGYREILNVIYREAMGKERAEILDIGFGTAVLTGRLYDHGHSITGIDFSREMMTKAQEKMPDAHLIQADLQDGFPSSVKEKSFDIIISTYTLHHLTDQKKGKLIKELLTLLNPGGKLLIGDISFRTREDHDACREENRGHWDEDEFYFVEEEWRKSLHVPYEYHQISHCGGVYMMLGK